MKEKRGAVLVFGIFFILIVFAVMGYVYEMGRMTVAKMRAQNAADAAAMGGQTVLSNLRNIATTHYMVADLFRRIAVTSSKGIPPMYIGMIGYSWNKKDLFINQLPDNNIEYFVRLYHFLFHTQDFAVTRLLAAYDSKIFFRDYLKEEAENHFSQTRSIMQNVSAILGFLNLYGWPPDENMMEGNEWGFAVVRFEKAPGWAPEGLQVDYEEEVDGPNGHRIKNIADERKMNKKLGRAYAQAIVFIPPSNFLMRTFLTRNWGKIGAINEWFSFLEGMWLPVRTDAAAGPREVYFDIGLPEEIPLIGMLREDGYWYFPQLIPTIKVEGNSPIEGQWPYH